MGFTREELIKRCEESLVDEESWYNRDSHESQKKVGVLWALLKDGCEFEIVEDDSELPTEDTIWIRVYSKDFMYYEGRGSKGDELFYLPTKGRLNDDYDDWY